jgi:hypothetical protein
MLHGDAIDAPRALDRAMVDREDHSLPLPQGYDFDPRLHAGPLLRQYEFPSGEIDARPREQQRDLEREDVFAVQVLVQAVVIVGAVPKQERRRFRLASPCDSV